MILVFKKGSSHTFHGVDCQLKRIHIAELREYEKKGWTTDHRELAQKPVEEVKSAQKQNHQQFKKSQKG